MLRVAISGWVGVCIVSAKVTVQFDAAGLFVAGQRRHLRAVEANAERLALVQRHRLTSARSEPPLPRIASISIGLLESNTSHTVSARRNNAAGVAAAKENVRRRPSLSRWALTTSAARHWPALLGVRVAAGGGSEAASVSAAARLPGAAFPLAQRRLPPLGAAGNGFGAASGLISILACCGDGLRRRRRDLAGLP